jgi:hypothetical protein
MGISVSLERILHVVLCNFLLSLPSLGIPCPVDFSPSSSVTHVESDEKHCLRLGGSWKVFMYLVCFN